MSNSAASRRGGRGGISDSLLLIVWAFVVASLVFQFYSSQPSARQLSVESFAIFGLGIWSLTRVAVLGFWAPQSMFFLVLSIFHIGLAPFWFFGAQPTFPRPSDYEWFNGQAGELSLAIVNIGLAGFVLGALLLPSISGRVQVSRILSESAQDEVDIANQFARGGSIVLLAGIGLWSYRAFSVGGFGIIFGSYREFLTETDGTSLGFTYMLMGLGLGLCMIAPAKGIVRFAVLVFVSFATVAFFLGLRGEVLFPIAVAVSVLATRRKMPGAFTVLAALTILLILISGAQNIRKLGIGHIVTNTSSFDPTSAIVELGTTIRVVVQTVFWHYQNAEPLANGATYSVSFVRFFESVVSPASRLPAAQDFRLMNSEIAARSGNIGGSIVAEAYHNFNVIGVVLVLGLVGLLMSAFSSSTISVRQLALYVAMAVPLFNHIRNSFVPVVPGILICFACVGVIDALGRRKSRQAKFQRRGEFLC